MSDIERIEEALRLLAERIREARERYPEAESRLERKERLALDVELSLDPDEDEVRAGARRLADSIDEGVREIVSQASAFAPGRVLHLRSGRSDEASCAPGSSREVFGGQSPDDLDKAIRRHVRMLD